MSGRSAGPESPPPATATGTTASRLFVALYLGIWLAICGALVFFMVRAGYHWSLAVVSAYVLYEAVNAPLGYWARRRRSRLEGTPPPPPFLVYAFAPSGLHQEVRMPRIVRIALGLVILPFGLALAAFVGFALFEGGADSPHPVAGLVLALIVLPLGLAIAYVGLRLLVMRNDEPLLGLTRRSR